MVSTIRWPDVIFLSWQIVCVVFMVVMLGKLNILLN